MPAALALAGMGLDEQKAALAVLTKLLRDEEAVARQQAAVALGHLGPEAQAAIGPLTKALQDGHYEVRKAAAEALKRIKKKLGQPDGGDSPRGDGDGV